MQFIAGRVCEAFFSKSVDGFKFGASRINGRCDPENINSSPRDATSDVELYDAIKAANAAKWLVARYTERSTLEASRTADETFRNSLLTLVRPPEISLPYFAIRRQTIVGLTVSLKLGCPTLCRKETSAVLQKRS